MHTIALASLLLAQVPPDLPDGAPEKQWGTQVPAEASTAAAPVAIPGWATPVEAVAILAFGIGALVVIMQLRKSNALDDGTVKLFGLVVVVVAGAFIVLAGFSAAQMATYMSILAGALGYVFGRQWDNHEPKPPHHPVA